MQLSPSELILNADGSIYHLNLLPEDIANTIITVGDPDRVVEVSKHFDTIDVKKGKREFLTHTGYLSGKRLSVISTGIGTDNIDIVLNELDALVNIDFESRTINKNRIRLKIIRLGTTGAIQPEIPIDSFLMSALAIGFDGLLHFYEQDFNQYKELEDAFLGYTQWSDRKARPYVVGYDESLGQELSDNRIRLGFTATNTGFYGPQGRSLRLIASQVGIMSKMASFKFNDLQITNLEMETSGIYALAKLLGHQAVSLNCILANRATGEFSRNPSKAIHELIVFTLTKLTIH